MASPRQTAALLLRARRAAGLSQRELARRAGTAQSVVARIELADVSPTWDTFERLLLATGQQLRANLEPAPVVDSHMLDDVVRIRALTPESRLQEVANLSRFILGARRV